MYGTIKTTTKKWDARTEMQDDRKNKAHKWGGKKPSQQVKRHRGGGNVGGG